MNEDLYKMCSFINDYRKETEEFYKQYFSNRAAMYEFFDRVFENDTMDKIPRRMMNQVVRFIELAKDMRKLRPGKDAFVVMCIRICIESLCKLKQTNGMKNEKVSFFDTYYLDKQYFIDNFRLTSIDGDEKVNDQLTIDEFAMTIKMMRDMVVHAGDYWSAQLFHTYDIGSTIFVMKTEEKIRKGYDYHNVKEHTYLFESSINYDKFINYFIQACIRFIQSYIDQCRYISSDSASSRILDKNLLSIGVDGCKNGWIIALVDNSDLRIENFHEISDILEKYDKFDTFLIDMVIGLPSDHTHIRPDTEARKNIPGRASTIFAVPCRQAVYADTEKEQIQQNVKVLGKSLAKQTMAIIPKISEVDTFLNQHTEYKNVIKESHPEVCFARLNGGVVMSKKSEKDGLLERIHILSRFLPDLTLEFILEKSKLYKCNADDIVDAICLAVTGNLYKQGKGECIPERPMQDESCLMMQMIIPKKETY
ncbi:MAG TPA: DUF429 domain-containing protein [Lachnospiraceae bacterium]|nr:DUF429 domain-containing protein [Lachnospiraceae bacterium]